MKCRLLIALTIVACIATPLYPAQRTVLPTRTMQSRSPTRSQESIERYRDKQEFLRMTDSAYPDYEVYSQQVEATGYAPLDPKAKKGMCYSGSRYTTASGVRVSPTRTIAAPPHIPFGTWIFHESFGWRRVEDRGGAIKGDRIDICFATRQQALVWGRRSIEILMLVPVSYKEGVY